MKGGTVFAFVALMAAQVASTQFSLIYYQDCVPEKVKKLKNDYKSAFITTCY
jgi:cyclic lactone autoinducer peptide